MTLELIDRTAIPEAGGYKSVSVNFSLRKGSVFLTGGADLPGKFATVSDNEILEEIKQKEDILTGGALNSIRLYAKAFNEKDEIISKKIEGNKKIVTLKDGSNITIGEEYRLESYNNIIDKNIKTFNDNEENKKKAKELLITTMKK